MKKMQSYRSPRQRRSDGGDKARPKSRRTQAHPRPNNDKESRHMDGRNHKYNQPDHGLKPEPIAGIWWLMRGMGAFLRDLCKEIRDQILRSKKRKKRMNRDRQSRPLPNAVAESRLKPKDQIVKAKISFKENVQKLRKHLPERKTLARYSLACLGALATGVSLCLINARAGIGGLRARCTRQNLSLVSLVLLTLLGGFGFSGLNIACAALIKAFDTSVSLLHWLNSGYLLVLALTVTISPWLIRKISGRLLFFIAALSFLGGTVLAGFAANLYILLAARLLTAIGHGLSLPLALAMVYGQFPAWKQKRIAALLLFWSGAGTVLGYVLGGLIVSRLPWQGLFWLMIPFCLLSLVTGGVTVAGHPREEQGEAPAFPLALLLCLAVIALSFGFTATVALPDLFWAALMVSAAAVALLIKSQLKCNHPFLAVVLLKNHRFAAVAAAVVLAEIIFYGFLLLLPILAQKGMGFDSVFTGLVLLSGPLLRWVLGVLPEPILFGQHVKSLLILGTLALFTGLQIVYFQTFTAATVCLTFLLLSLGEALLSLSGQRLLLEQLPLAVPEREHNFAAIAALRQLGAAVGTALAALLLTTQSANYLDFKTREEAVYLLGFHGCIRFFVLFSFIAIILAVAVWAMDRQNQDDSDECEEET